MNRTVLMVVAPVVFLAGFLLAAQDEYTVKVPGGLGLAEFRGYESWQTISVSRNEKVSAAILGNPAMAYAYQAGIPANGKPVPDGAKMAKLRWTPKPHEFFPDATVPDKQVNVDFMVKDSKTFADSGGWGGTPFSTTTPRPTASLRAPHPIRRRSGTTQGASDEFQSRSKSMARILSCSS